MSMRIFWCLLYKFDTCIKKEHFRTGYIIVEQTHVAAGKLYTLNTVKRSRRNPIPSKKQRSIKSDGLQLRAEGDLFLDVL